MNKNNTLWLVVLLVGFLLAGCATQKAAGGNVDVCKLTNPPKEAKKYEAHAADLLEYPEKIANDYTGCQAVWIANFYAQDKHHLLVMIQFNAGKIRHVDWYEPDQAKVVCEYDENKALLNGSAENCLPYERWFRSE
jgi:predicted small secreted protein